MIPLPGHTIIGNSLGVEMAQKEIALQTSSGGSVRAIEHLALRMRPDQLVEFSLLLQQGVAVPVVIGCSLRSLLCDQFSIPAEYVTGRITTIFLDSRPVDNLDSAVIREGSRVTLSAAMPGLVGAVMRSGGFYASLRQGITHTGADSATAAKKGMIRLKLFNLLLAELGPLILARGVILERAELSDLLQRLPASCRLGVARLCQGGEHTLPAAPAGTGPVLLTVTFRE